MSHEGVIHGDVKPENILVFAQESGCFAAKVTDFGYSTLFATNTDLVRMPDSGIWTAPERHHRDVFPHEARKMDAYSFGMLCMWLLCYNTKFKSDSSFRKDVEESCEKGMSLICQLLDHSEGLADEDRHGIHKLLSITLNQDPDERVSDFNKLIPCLSSHRLVSL